MLGTAISHLVGLTSLQSRGTCDRLCLAAHVCQNVGDVGLLPCWRGLLLCVNLTCCPVNLILTALNAWPAMRNGIAGAVGT